MGRRDDVGQLVPGQGRHQTEGRLTGLYWNLDEVVVERYAVSAPVYSAADPLDQASG